MIHCLQRFTCFLLLLGTINLQAQTEITGRITDTDNQPLIGANIYIEDTYDGATSDSKGNFHFTTIEDSGTVVVSYMGYKTFQQKFHFTNSVHTLNIQLEPTNTTLNTVTITAGAFEAGDEKKGVVLNSIDIATTAGALADISATMNFLPGTQLVGESGELFVRGGASYETRTFIDGLRVTTPYSSRVPDIPARGRFSPFMFKGTVFSTGGYSAEYGQALSSALILNTQDMPEQSETAVSLMTVGTELAHTERWENTSLVLSGSYTNLKPYMSLIPQQRSWETAPLQIGGAMGIRHKISSTGLLKVFSSISHSDMKMNLPEFSNGTSQGQFGIANDNVFVNTTFKELLGNKVLFHGGLSVTHNEDRMEVNSGQLDERHQSIQAKGVFSRSYDSQFTLRAGITALMESYEQQFDPISQGETTYVGEANEILTAVFAEGQWNWGKNWALRGGLRGEYSEILQQFNLAPRLSMAYKTGKYAQVSMAMGQYYQNPELEWLSVQPSLQFERADHLILNYQWEKDRRLLRLEGYYKQYHNLTRFAPSIPYDPNSFENTGNGFARGIELFWRDRETFKYVDYWISYSFLDTDRLYRDFPESATPSFASRHNLSFVGKYWLQKQNTQLGLTYRLASPRPYDNPNEAGFNVGRTPTYHDLSANLSYLTQLWGNFTILHVSVTNLLGTNQVFGYRYSPTPDSDGQYGRLAVTPPAKRFVFVGLFITIN